MEKLFAKIKKETLSRDEKTEILSSLRKFVAENPAQKIKSPFYEEWFVFRYRAAVVPVAIVLIFMLAGGTVSASKKSLPGDILYPVKMLRENAESLATTDTKARAQIEALHAVSRLQEVEQIATSKGELDKGAGQEISKNFETELKDVVSNIDELKNKGKKEEASVIWSDFNESVSKYEKTITELSNSTSTKKETKEELDHVISNVRSQMKDKHERFQNQEREASNKDEGEVKGAETEKDEEEKPDKKETTNTDRNRSSEEKKD